MPVKVPVQQIGDVQGSHHTKEPKESSVELGPQLECMPGLSLCRTPPPLPLAPPPFHKYRKNRSNRLVQRAFTRQDAPPRSSWSSQSPGRKRFIWGFPKFKLSSQNFLFCLIFCLIRLISLFCLFCLILSKLKKTSVY